MDENMRLYEQGRSVPKNAQKAFSTGRFSGTDINPMWRIKKLTEMFGPVGFGWYTEVTRQEVIPADDGNLMAFVDINLFVKDGDTWSKPIFGTGGNTLKAKGKALVGFECARGPDRDKANAALKAGAFAVGNW